MAVIVITVTDSSDQLLSGIPKTVTITTNIPSSIFYTLDGTDPSASSTLYLNPIEMPTNVNSVTLKIFATDGTDSSPIVTKEYAPNIVPLRQSHDEVTGSNISDKTINLYPFGDASPSVEVQYGNIGGDVVDRPDVPGIPDGFDGSGTGEYANYTDKPINEYKILFSDSDYLGERGHGIGTLPAEVTIHVPEPNYGPESTDANSRYFNPRALVIYQDNTKEPFDDDILQINRNYFSLENPEIVRDGVLLDAQVLGPTGSFVRAHYNPREHTITYYYHDSATLRWIISKEPYKPNPRAPGLFNIVFSSRKRGDRNVFRWIPFKGQRLP